MKVKVKYNLGTYSSDFSSIDRMDIVNLAGIHKYNALTIFQRVVYILNLDTSKNIRRIEKTGSLSNNDRATTVER